MRIAFFLACLLISTAPLRGAEAPCAATASCQTPLGEYALAFPPNWDGAAPLRPLLWFHGHNSSLAGAMRPGGGLRRTFVDAGWLLIAPNGAANAAGVRRWPARTDAEWRDDMAFVAEVLADVASRVPLAAKPVVAGFSAGGSMAWMFGCLRGAEVDAVISVAGALRRPNPEICPSPPPRALHIHGFTDAQVPFEGRGIRDWHQGDVAETLALFRRSRGCRSNPHEIAVGDGWRARHWDCAGGLAYLEHDGGHMLPRGWTERALRWLETGETPVE